MVVDFAVLIAAFYLKLKTPLNGVFDFKLEHLLAMIRFSGDNIVDRILEIDNSEAIALLGQPQASTSGEKIHGPNLSYLEAAELALKNHPQAAGILKDTLGTSHLNLASALAEFYQNGPRSLTEITMEETLAALEDSERRTAKALMYVGIRVPERRLQHPTSSFTPQAYRLFLIISLFTLAIIISSNFSGNFTMLIHDGMFIL
ncbi:hypothetical protein FACS189472_09050 [Alphaproteobacteria bacterium]|nr:hypothetical protein FACS189472_09050 [Alphaproteobacteria bacterium]